MHPTYAPVYDPTAVMGRRFGAWIIDAMLGLILMFALFLSFAERQDFNTTSGAQAFCDDLNNGDIYACGQSEGTAFYIKYDDAGIIGLIGLGYWFLNDAVLTGILGFSIGKGIVGLRVVRQHDGRLAGFGRTTARWAMWIADGAPYCIGPLVGLISANASKGHRRVGDMVARTFVVDKHQVGMAPQVIGVTTPSPAFGGGYPPAPGYGGFPGAGQPGIGYPGQSVGGYPGPARRRVPRPARHTCAPRVGAAARCTTDHAAALGRTPAGAHAIVDPASCATVGCAGRIRARLVTTARGTRTVGAPERAPALLVAGAWRTAAHDRARPHARAAGVRRATGHPAAPHGRRRSRVDARRRRTVVGRRARCLHPVGPRHQPLGAVGRAHP